MRVVRSLDTFFHPETQRQLSKNTAVGVTIGNFDGIHLGHQVLFNTLRDELEKLATLHGQREARRILFTFYPHPRLVFEKLRGIVGSDVLGFQNLSSFRRKCELAELFGFDYLFAQRFSKCFRECAAEEFVERYLVSALHADLVVVGHDWSFGKGRKGTPEVLKDLGKKYGFSVHVVEPVAEMEKRVSSGTVKQALEGGDLERVTTFLGRNFFVSGRVRSGESRGRKIGAPTANLEFKQQVLPRDGVYAAIATVGGKEIPAVLNIGFRPTFGGEQRIVEVHLLQGEGYALYGKRVGVEFIERLREEKKFPDGKQLRAAIEQDIIAAKEVLSERFDFLP